MNDEVVGQLYRCLVEALRRRGHPESEPVKLSDLYQDLVPYREVRPALGVELKADYEHALLRLLSGEGDLLRLEPADARDELRREVEAPYPFVGLFRKFAASDVWVALREIPDGSAPDGSAPPAAGSEPEPASPVRDASSEPPLRVSADAGGRRGSDGGGRWGTRSGGPAPARAHPPVQLHRDGPPDPTERLTHAGSECVFCKGDLPPGRRIRFCPYCGGDQRLRPCPRCEAVLDRDWRYCINCGHDVSAS